MAFRGFEAKLVAVPMDEHGLQVDELERRLAGGLRPKLLYTIPDHQNPAGVSLSGERRAPLVELARRYGFLIVEDVAYRELGFSGDSLPSLWSLAPGHRRAGGDDVEDVVSGRPARLGGRPRRRSRPGSSPRSRTPTSAPARSGSGSSRSPFAAAGSTSSWCARVRSTSGKCERLLAALERLDAGRGALDAAARRLLLLADAARRRRLGRARGARGRGRRRHRAGHALLPGRARRATPCGSRSAWSTRRRSTTASSGWGRCCEQARGNPLPLGGHAERGAQARPGPEAHLDRPDDGGTRVPRQGMHRPEALARERAADLHPGGSPAIPARRGRVRGRRRLRRWALHLPSHLPHMAEALEDTLDVDIFCPPRQDWLDGSHAYLRHK